VAGEVFDRNTDRTVQVGCCFLLRDGRAGTWRWTISETGEEVGFIGYRVASAFGALSATLSYSCSGQAITEEIRIERPPMQSASRRAERRPWEQTTGPRSAIGKALVARDPWKGGIRALLRELSCELRRQQDTLDGH
jgi:hypothetical protein